MAVTALCGFEMLVSNLLHEPGISGGLNWDTSTSIVRTGSRSLRLHPATTGSAYVSLGTGNYIHFGLYIASMPTVARLIAGGAGSVHLTLNSDGTVSYYDGANLRGSAALSTGTWYWVGIRAASSGSSVPLLQIDGTTAVSGTTAGTFSGILGPFGSEASAIDIHFDDYIVDDAGFLAPSKVALLVPISDNAREGSVLWTAGAGGTTNLYAGVDNIPPAGVASANETNTTNIEHPGGSVSANFDTYKANLTTFTTAGVGASDTVIAFDAFLRHGEDVSTGTKNLAMEMTSNPAIANIWQGTAGADGGAHSAETGVWRTNDGIYTGANLGSLTLGTSPVMRVSRNGTENRVACVDFMGAYVAWTPAPPVAGIRPRQPVVLQAVQRAASWCKALLRPLLPRLTDAPAG